MVQYPRCVIYAHTMQCSALHIQMIQCHISRNYWKMLDFETKSMFSVPPNKLIVFIIGITSALFDLFNRIKLTTSVCCLLCLLCLLPCQSIFTYSHSPCYLFDTHNLVFIFILSIAIEHLYLDFKMKSVVRVYLINIMIKSNSNVIQIEHWPSIIRLPLVSIFVRSNLSDT